MDWNCYKQRCDKPEMWSRWMLNETIELVGDQSHLAQTLEAVLREEPLAKPPGHRGGPETDMFELALDIADVDTIVAAVRQAVEHKATTSGGRGLGGFAEAWQEFQRHVSRKMKGEDA
ncbi:MAG: hypothetical protein O7C67_00655 [Gammaproteobacteria bacterium]|nr:hypothetical protein [Gammaproteobacteria bacterium]